MAACWKAMLFGDTILRYGWFFQATFFLYWVFWFSCKFFNGRKQWISLLVGMLLYYVVCLIMHTEYMFIQTPQFFLFGVLWEHVQDKFDFLLQKKRYWHIVLLTLLAVIALFLCHYLFSFALVPYPLVNDWIIVTLKSTFVIILVILAFPRTSINNPICDWLGIISLEIYAMHGIVIMCFGWRVFHFQNDYLYVVAVILSTVLVSFIANTFFKIISCFWNRNQVNVK